MRGREAEGQGGRGAGGGKGLSFVVLYQKQLVGFLVLHQGKFAGSISEIKVQFLPCSRLPCH